MISSRWKMCLGNALLDKIMLYRPSVTLSESRELVSKRQIDQWLHSYSLDLPVSARFAFIHGPLLNMFLTEIPDRAFESSCRFLVQ